MYLGNSFEAILKEDEINHTKLEYPCDSNVFWVPIEGLKGIKLIGVS